MTQATEKTEWPAGELETLIVRMGSGDRQALEQLYGRTRAAVYAAALAIVKNAADAQDVAQDAFVRAWEAADRYRPQGSPMAWLLTITRNQALSRLRQSRHVTALEDGQWDAIPGDASVTAEERMLLQTALAGLDDMSRQIVLLHAVSGLKHRQIAALLQMPLATVLSKYHRALKKLRTEMKGDDAS